MAEKWKEKAAIISQKEIAPGIFELWIKTEQIAGSAKPGQFISLYVNDKSKLLPRPISICEINRIDQALRLVYRVTGEHTGTALLSQMGVGKTIEVLGPLGNGFPLKNKTTMVIGGGIGIPPMLETAKQLPGETIAVLGYANSDLFLMKEFQEYGEVYVATDDGSFGTGGTVLDAIRENDITAEIILACGPKPMLRAVKEFAKENGIEYWVSMEEHMACGIGACLACVCQSTSIDSHSHVANKRVCKDGPVFLAEEVDLS